MPRRDANTELARVYAFKHQSTVVGDPLGPELIGFFQAVGG